MKKILIVDCGSSKVPFIQQMCIELNVVTEIQKLEAITSIQNFDGIIISGAPILLTQMAHTPFIEKAQLLFSTSNMPILGICFGHQLMGLFHGANISRCNEDRDWQEIHFHRSFQLLNVTPGQYQFKEDHCECIDLPGEFILCGSSDICTNEAMHHMVKPWFGVQFHPEVSEHNGQELFRNFINICKEK